MLWVALFLAGCQAASISQGYHTTPERAVSQAQQATAANTAGLECAARGDLDEAEAGFRQALAVEPTFAAAHNNLGLVLLRKQRFYESALEFRFASDLAPSAPEPVLNLARLYEAVGWQEQAISTYESALQLAPDRSETMARLATLYRRSGRKPSRVHDLLCDLMTHADEHWATWATAALDGRSCETGGVNRD